MLQFSNLMDLCLLPKRCLIRDLHEQLLGVLLAFSKLIMMSLWSFLWNNCKTWLCMSWATLVLFFRFSYVLGILILLYIPSSILHHGENFLNHENNLHWKSKVLVEAARIFDIHSWNFEYGILVVLTQKSIWNIFSWIKMHINTWKIWNAELLNIEMTME